MGVNASIGATFSYTDSGTTGTAGTVAETVKPAYNPTIAQGTGAGKVDMAWSAKATLTNASTTFTLSSLAKPSGTIAPTKVRGLLIVNRADPAVASNLLVVGAAAVNPWTNAFTGSINIPAGGALMLTAPNAAAFAIASGSNEQLKLTATGVVPYEIYLLPASA